MEAEIGQVQYETIQDAIDAVPSNTQTTIKVLKDVELTESLSVSTDQNIVFNFQNYTISVASGSSIAVFENDGTITISNGTLTSSVAVGAINNNATGNLTITGGTISTTGTKQAVYNNGGIVTITGTANLHSTSNQRATVHNLAGGTMTITGGTIVSTRFAAVDNMGGTVIIGIEDGNINTSSPVIQGNTYGITSTNTNAQIHPEFSFYDGIIKYRTDIYNDAKIALDETEGNLDFFCSTEVISGVTYNTAILATSSTITFDPNGGTLADTIVEYANGEPFGTLPVPEYKGYAFEGWFKQSDGTQVTSNTIVREDMTLVAHWRRVYIAKIGNTTYDSLQDAVDAVPKNNTPTTVVLMENIVIDERLKILANQNVVFDFQNYTIQNKAGVSMPLIENKGTITITNGTLTSTATQGIINNESGGRVTITGGNILATGTRQAIYNNNNAIVEITGSAYLSAVSTERATVQNLAGGTIRITGGTIVSDKQEAVKNAGTLYVGTSGTPVSTSSPVLQGATYGVTNTSTFSFYDGIIKGKTGAISGSITAVETDYQKVEGQEMIGGSNYITAYLVHT